MIPKCIKQKQLEDKVDKLSTYSTEEQRIGTWFGKPLYRKVVVYKNSDIIGAYGTITNIEILHKISNLNQCVNASLFTDSYRFPIFYGLNTVERAAGITSVDNTKINLRIINDTWGPKTWYITLEYIKTTD